MMRPLGSNDLPGRLSWLIATRRVPDHVCNDNGSEFTATSLRQWLGKVGVKSLHIEPDSPWEESLREEPDQQAT